MELNLTSNSSLKNSWAAHGPGNSNRLEVVVTHENNISKISSTPKDPSLMTRGANVPISSNYRQELGTALVSAMLLTYIHIYIYIYIYNIIYIHRYRRSGSFRSK